MTTKTEQNGTKTEFERAIEARTGETIESIREMPIDERRKRIEKKFGKIMKFLSFYPLIGRGSVLHTRTKSREEIEAELEKALH